MISGHSNGYGAGKRDFFFLTLSQDFSSCSNLITNDISLESSDVTSHADLIFQNLAFTEDFSYSGSIPYTNVAPTVTDILPQLGSLEGKQICPLVA